MEQKRNGRRVILFPVPLQGCINPMLQLAKILYYRGFSITTIHTRLNAPPAALNRPLFSFLEIADGLSESQASTQDITLLLTLLNRSCESPFRDCLTQLLLSGNSEDKETITCVISDTEWHFTQAVAESFRLPSIALNTYTASFFFGHLLIPSHRNQWRLPVPDSEAESIVPEFPPLRKKELSQILAENEELLDPFLIAIGKATKASSGLILMSCEELERDSLSRSHEGFQLVPIFPIGPFHSYFPASSSSSLFPSDETCIPWLDKQGEKSVIYLSFGSIATISESEFLEIAWGLSNSDQPFLWVVRPGFVNGSEWIEPLPQGFLESLKGRGKIVKWAPQQDVLSHRAIGGFWTHCGWNSTQEGICNGVPMICQPCIWDQMLNARFVSDVWRAGLHLEGRIERHEIKKNHQKTNGGR